MRRASASLTIAVAVAASLTAHVAFRTIRELRHYRRYRARIASRWVTISGVAGTSPLRMRARVAVRHGVTSTPVVLVHGFGVGSAYHVPLMTHLSAAAPVYAPDLPGHGCSDHDVRPLSAKELARALARWMDAERLRGALLVGHSYGCQIAAELAVTRPELVSRLVLIGPMSDPSAGSAGPLFARAAVTIPFERPSFLLLGLAEYLRAGLAVMATDLREMVAYRLEAVLPGAEQPVGLIRGSRDYLAPHAFAAALARAAGAPPPDSVPGWGHAVNYAAPGIVTDLITRE